MASTTVTDPSQEMAEQRALWRRQTNSLPSLRGGKRVWFALVVELVEQIAAGKAQVLDSRPDVPAEFFDVATRKVGAAPSAVTSTWREYGSFLKSIGFAQAARGGLDLTPSGHNFRTSPVPEALGAALASRFRLFVESLAFVSNAPSTVEDLDSHLRGLYETGWTSLSGTRDRIDWLDALGLVEGAGGRRWKTTEVGEALLSRCVSVSPEALVTSPTAVRDFSEAPPEIGVLLSQLSTTNDLHEARSTYNIWVPSPAASPNKVENLRTIVNAALDPTDREELLGFIADTFSLQRSSVDSMMPFLRASGLLHEIGLGVYQATTPARSWIESEEDINFIRILHCNMRFVGEMIRTVKPGVTRADMYLESAKYGLNVDKSRWIASFLEDVGLVEQPRYGSLRATPLGLAFLEELPLASAPTTDDPEQVLLVEQTQRDLADLNSRTDQLVTLSKAPHAQSLGSGKAFEIAVRDAFLTMGFHARTISGSGDTDVVVSWRNQAGDELVAIVEVKSRSNGQVTHTDISDVALETHLSQNRANYAAVVGPSFAGETIKNMAAKRSWALVDAQRLGEITEAAVELGLSPQTTGLLFKVPGGLDELAHAIEQRQRELSVVSFAVSQLVNEQRETGDSITARDMSRDGRKSDLHPTLEEVLNALSHVARTAPEAIREMHKHDDVKFSTYALGDVSAAASRLRALANAMETSLPQDPNS
ncbi:restriction endonuclease [Cryobacterium sp. 1639]|uniref:restriction endonuclease n=1 Tax=Cryobacterium inferilacus TaxID=2866629 RepID=UPI001C733F34|nr:restriction endonuclease [Cryobacterium sp. 1639]MBX0299538.1 restriction endonuclease [Cryobacterium sp. 1639]